MTTPITYGIGTFDDFHPRYKTGTEGEYCRKLIERRM